MCWICSDNDYTHIPKKTIVQFKKASLYVVVSCDATSIFDLKFTVQQWSGFHDLCSVQNQMLTLSGGLRGSGRSRFST